MELLTVQHGCPHKFCKGGGGGVSPNKASHNEKEDPPQGERRPPQGERRPPQGEKGSPHRAQCMCFHK